MENTTSTPNIQVRVGGTVHRSKIDTDGGGSDYLVPACGSTKGAGWATGLPVSCERCGEATR